MMELIIPKRHPFLSSLISSLTLVLFWVFPWLKKWKDERQIRAWRTEQELLKSKLVTEDVHEWQKRLCIDDVENADDFDADQDCDDDDPIQSLSQLRFVGGVDVSFAPDEISACASLVVCDLKNDSKIVYEDFLPYQITVPYKPGFLAFREVPALMELWQKLTVTKPVVVPQVVLIDGNGILHPRGFGKALEDLCTMVKHQMEYKLFSRLLNRK